MSNNNLPDTNKPNKKKKYLKIYDLERYSPRKRERMKKRLKRNIIRWVIFTVISQIIMVSFFMFSIGDSMLATEENTYTKQISVKDTEIYRMNIARHSDWLCFYTQGEKYVVVWSDFKDKTMDNAIQQLKTEDELTITVFKKCGA